MSDCILLIPVILLTQRVCLKVIWIWTGNARYPAQACTSLRAAGVGTRQAVSAFNPLNADLNPTAICWHC